MEFRRKLRELRKAAGMNQTELGAALGLQKSAISMYERGDRTPKIETLEAIADFFNIDLNELLSRRERSEIEGPTMTLNLLEEELIHRLRRLDSDGRDAVNAVLDVEYKRCTRKPQTAEVIHFPAREMLFLKPGVSAGTGIALDDEEPDRVWVPLTKASEKADFVLRVSGDSMEPKFHDGDLLLIEQTTAVDPGELGIFGVNGEGFFKRAGKGQLESLNSKYPPRRLLEGDSVTTFGRVLGKTEKVNGEGLRDDG